METEWPRVTIESLIASGAIVGHKDGNHGAQYPRVDEFGNMGVPFLTAKSLSSGRIDIENAPRLADRRADSLRLGWVRPADVLLSHNATVGRVAVMPEFEGRILIGTSLTYFRLDSSRIIPKYLAAYFTGKDFQDQLAAMMSQTTRNQVPVSAQRKLSIILPPLSEQKRIAHILGALDDKIELNCRMNATLEEMARALFKSWFIDFDPVRRNAESGESRPEDALFPNSFEDSEMGEIPKGWHVGKLGEVATNIKRGVNVDKIGKDVAYIGLEHMPRRSIALSDWATAGKLESNKSKFKRGEILFGKLRPYFHKIGVAPIDGVCSTDILVISSSKQDWFGFVLGHVSSVELIDYTTALSTGTKMPRTKWQDIAEFKVILPTVDISAAFTQQILPFVKRIEANIHQTLTLANIRDSLLPKLLDESVKLKLRQAEK